MKYVYSIFYIIDDDGDDEDADAISSSCPVCQVLLSYSSMAMAATAAAMKDLFLDVSECPGQLFLFLSLLVSHSFSLSNCMCPFKEKIRETTAKCYYVLHCFSFSHLPMFRTSFDGG